jgi:glycosyltransferase involved in cell wall biosynthesis
MNIGFVTSPLFSGHAGRGVGFYTRHLFDHLSPWTEKHGDKLIEVKDPEHLPAGIDLLHYPFFDLFFPSLSLSHSVPVVVTIHDVIPLEFPQRFPPGIRGNLNLLRQKLALSRVKLVLTDSYASVKAIRQLLHVPHEKIRLIYLAPAPHFRPVKDQAKLKALAKKYHLPDKFILYVGDVNWNKNLYGLLAAAKQVDYPLVLVGKQSAALDSLNFSHPELQHLRPVSELINRPDSRVYRLGFVPDADLVGIYNLATVYCQPSFAEGFGLPVLEAMACGTPVASSKTHSLPEIAGTAAVYFDPQNIESIAWALDRLLSDTKTAKAYSQAGLLQVKRFSWDYTAQSTVAAYHEVFDK